MGLSGWMGSPRRRGATAPTCDRAGYSPPTPSCKATDEDVANHSAPSRELPSSLGAPEKDSKTLHGGTKEHARPDVGEGVGQIRGEGASSIVGTSHLQPREQQVATGRCAPDDGRKEDKQTSSQSQPQTGRPTVESLLPEPKNKHANASTANEWDLLSPDELRVLRRAREWLGSELFSQAPLDLLVTFARGYAYCNDWAEASTAHLEHALKWRAEMNANTVVASGLPNRELFEKMCQNGPIGHDSHGHLVILERLGRVNVGQLLQAFDEESYIRHQLFSREAVRMINTAKSLRTGKRVYKVVVVIDLDGLSMSHLSKRFVNLMKRVNDQFAEHYPETAFKFYVINAPLVFRTAWAIAKQWMHPITVRKFSIMGSDYRRKFDDAGIVLLEDDIPKTVKGWAEEVQNVIDEFGVSRLSRGYMPEKDLTEVSSVVGVDLHEQ
mmetsp:Transcript_25783/g.71089  ORF Transcript_25783/g.71089 Transcript_25783/m.71089 type:complete len:439 (-) Transcript_25783:319-1635(-)|eukprot:scaffold185518_cov36-Tisochrysis_lutea.AAC.2